VFWVLVVGMAGIALGNVALSAYRTRSVLATDPA
jgi:hypothetical protein